MFHLLSISLGCIGPDGAETPETPAPSPGLLLVTYRSLDGGTDGVALVDADPDSPDFGAVLDDVRLGAGVTPHHLYFDLRGERAYVTSLGAPYLHRLHLDRERHPRGVTELDVADNQVAEDIWFSPDGTRFYVTFLGGGGAPRDGSVGVYDAETDTLLETITSDAAPEILWPHGLSGDASRDVLLVTSTTAPDMSAYGGTVTAITLSTSTPSRSWTIEAGSAPVEVMLLRGELPPHAIVTTMVGGDVWVAPWDDLADTYGTFLRAVEGDNEGWGVALELYVRADVTGEPELYVTFAEPGIVAVYGLDALPALPLRRTIAAAPGAHHLSFFERDGRTLVVTQNNLIALPGLDTGTLTVSDAETGEELGVVDLPETHGLLPEAVESAFGASYDLHH